MKLTKAFLTLSLCVGALSVSAQGFYDDDIYYDASKDTKAKEEIAAHKKAVEEERIRQQQEYEAQMNYLRSLANRQNTYNPNLGGGDYAAADTYALPGTGSARNVDEYNRRGAYASSSSDSATSALANDDEFAYTRRIERFHNGDIIASVNDPELVDYYYSTASQPDINIYVVNPGWNRWNYGWNYWGPSWYDPWWPSSPYWAWNYWGPSWSLGWNSWWGPSWSGGWGPSWGWGGPGWGPGWGPAWGGGAWHAGNYTPRGRQSTGIRNGYTGLGSSHPGSPFNTTNGRRSGNTVTRQSLGNYRPGSSSSSSPAYNGSMGNYRPGSNSAPATAPSYNNNSGNSYNSGAQRSGRGATHSSTPSYSSPSRSSGGSWGGGATRSSGGSGRSGRR